MNNEEIKEKENTAQTANETANAENDTENTSEANTEAFDNKEQAAAEEKTEEKDPLQKAQEELESLKDKYLRTVAEFDNYRKRSLKEKTELVLNGGEKTITAILPVLDDMERAVANADKADLVISFSGSTMTDGNSAFFPGNFYELLCNSRTCH